MLPGLGCGLVRARRLIGARGLLGRGGGGRRLAGSVGQGGAGHSEGEAAREGGTHDDTTGTQ
ncbi:hypothetical protein [Rhodococcoides corynebacterioides]|uniref:hypothetical protein n=1 Tax=Rhodococcoides corynebacterioides TaxID=53972 RepID=UPI003AF911CA